MRSFDIRSLRLALFITVLATTSGCMSELLTADMPLTLDAPSGTPLTQQIGARSEGVYCVAAGHDTFGDTLVALWRGGHLCFYAATEVIFVETAGLERRIVILPSQGTTGSSAPLRPVM